MLPKDCSNYFDSSMPYDHRREIVWSEIARIFRNYIKIHDSVLDIGAGYCHFINNIECKEKFALDLDVQALKNGKNDVIKIVGSCLEVDKLLRKKFDVIFASNLLEHFPIPEIHIILSKIKGLLKQNGKLIIIQPNYRYAYREYFDDFTHLTVLDHISLKRLLVYHGYTIKEVQKRFLPYSMDSNFPVFRWLVYIYLRSPIKPFAKQMLVVAEK